MNPIFRKLTLDLDKISLMRRIFVQRTAAKDGIYLGQGPAMEYIRRHPGCTQKDVADFIKVSPPSVAVMVKRMVRDGLIEKTPDESDMRQNRLTITARGEELSEQCRQMFEQVDNKIYAGFSEEELQQLSSYLERLIDNLANNEIHNTSPFALMQMVKNLESCEPNEKNLKKKEE